MERSRPRHYWICFIPGLILEVTGIVGLPAAVGRGDTAGVAEGVAWVCCGVLLMLLARTRQEASRGQLAWLYIAAGAAIGARLTAALLATS